MTTSELVPWRGANVPLLGNGEVSRSSLAEWFQWAMSSANQYMGPPMPVTTYGSRPAEPISNSFEGFVQGMLYSDGPVAAVEAYRLRVFGQAPLLYQDMSDGRPGDFFDDERLDRLRTPWPGGNLGDLMKRALIYGDFAGNAFIVDLEDELVLLRPDWVEIVLAKRMHRGGQVGWRQVGIVYYEGGLSIGDGVPFLPGEYCHFVPGLPDPLASFRGMSWLTPLVREVQADKAASDHKVAFFENAASPNLAVSLPKEISPKQFGEFVEMMDAKHKGVANAYKTLYTAGGADVTVVGANMQQMDFSAVQGKGETRVANAGGVSPALLSFSEGMQGSSLNAGNFVPSKRNFVDTTMRDLWTNMSGSIQKMDAFTPPQERASRLSYDPRDIPFLRDDEQDIAQRQQTQAATMSSLITAGYEPESTQTFIVTDDPMTLQHSGAFSVQLQPMGAQDANGDGMPDAEAEAADEYQQALDEFRADLEPFWDEIARRRPYRDPAAAEQVSARIDDRDTVEPGQFDDAEIERKYYNVRVAEGHVGGGRFRKIGDIAAEILNDWLDGKGDTDDPLDHFTQPQLKKIAEHHGIKTPPRAGKAALKLAILNDAKARHRDVHEGPKPRASFTLKGDAHRDTDVGVYVERKPDSKIFLRREKDGRPGTILESFDDLDALHSWAQEHGETELAGWAVKERDGSTPVKKAAKKAPSKLDLDPRDRRTPNADLVHAYRGLRSSMLHEKDHDFSDATDDDLKDLRGHIQADPRRDRLYDKSIAAIDAVLKSRGVPAKAAKRVPAKKAAPKKAAPAKADLGALTAEVESESLRNAVERILAGNWTEGGRLVTSTPERVTALRRLASVEVKVAGDNNRAHPSPELKLRLEAAEQDAARVRAVAAALNAAGSSERFRTGPVPVSVVVAPGANSSSSTWRATGFDGLDRNVPGATTAVTAYLRDPGFANSRLRTPDRPLHNQSIQELTGDAPFDTEAHAKAVAKAEKQITALDRVMEQSHTDSPMTVYRGASVADVALPDGDATGHEWVDAGFASTAVNRRVAEHSFAGRGRVLMTVRVPEGTPALQIDGLGESEVLLGRDLRYRVVADHGLTPAGARHIEVEVVPDDSIPPAEQAARDRQVKIDRADAVHSAVSEVEQLLSDGASDRALKARITSRTAGQPDLRQRLLAAVGDEPAMRKVLADLRDEEGLTPIGEAGAGARFDPNLHESIGGDIPLGASVTVVKPGHRFGDVTFPARVEAGDPPATSIPARPSAPWDNRVLDAAPVSLLSNLERPSGALTPTPAERAAFDAYGNDGQAINARLRSGGRITPPIAAMDAAMARSPLSTDVEVWRGVPGGADLPGLDLSGDVTGAEFTDRSFVSTSVSQSVAEQFAQLPGSGPKVVLRVTAPRGTKAVAFSGGGGITESQGELLLERGLTFRVTADHGSADGLRRLDVEIVPTSSPGGRSDVEVNTLAAGLDLSADQGVLDDVASDLAAGRPREDIARDVRERANVLRGAADRRGDSPDSPRSLREQARSGALFALARRLEGEPDQPTSVPEVPGPVEDEGVRRRRFWAEHVGVQGAQRSSYTTTGAAALREAGMAYASGQASNHDIAEKLRDTARDLSLRRLDEPDVTANTDGSQQERDSLRDGDVQTLNRVARALDAEGVADPSPRPVPEVPARPSAPPAPGFPAAAPTTKPKELTGLTVFPLAVDDLRAVASSPDGILIDDFDMADPAQNDRWSRLNNMVEQGLVESVPGRGLEPGAFRLTPKGRQAIEQSDRHWLWHATQNPGEWADYAASRPDSPTVRAVNATVSAPSSPTKATPAGAEQKARADLAAAEAHLEALRQSGDRSPDWDIRLLKAEDDARLARDKVAPFDRAAENQRQRAMREQATADYRTALAASGDDGSMDAKILDAVERLRGVQDGSALTGGWLGLEELRREVGGTRDEQDRALRRLIHAPGVRIIPVANTKALTEADRKAALRSGDSNLNAIGLEPDVSFTRAALDAHAPTRPAPRVPGKVAKATPAKTAPRVIAPDTQDGPSDELKAKLADSRRRSDAAFAVAEPVTAERFGAMSRDERLSKIREVAEAADYETLDLSSARHWARHVLDGLAVDELREMVDQLADISNWGTSEKRDKGQLAQAVMNLTGLNPDGKVDTANGRVSFNDLRDAAAKATPAKTARPAKKAAPKIAGSDTATALVDAGDDTSAIAAILAPLNSSQLKDLARTYQIRGASKMRRDQLVTALTETVSRRNLASGAGETIAESAQAAQDLRSLRAMTADARRDSLDPRSLSQLQDLLRLLGLPTSGSKQELLDRLFGGLESGVARAGVLYDEDEESAGDEDEEDADPDEDDEDLTDDDAPGPDEPDDDDLDDETLAHIHALLDGEDDEAPEATRADLALGRERLHRFWTSGKGLRKWLGHPHPWTSLYRHLRKYVGSERAKRMAAKWVHEVTGNWPGSDAHRVATGHKPRGNRIGPG